jgi:hypothetical protein
MAEGTSMRMYSDVLDKWVDVPDVITVSMDELLGE